jgi:hypothetical protein
MPSATRISIASDTKPRCMQNVLVLAMLAWIIKVIAE